MKILAHGNLLSIGLSFYNNLTLRQQKHLRSNSGWVALARTNPLLDF
jgi:hypothetical protein